MHGVGYDNLDLDAIQAAGISASNNPGFNASTLAEHTVMLMLVLLHASSRRTTRLAQVRFQQRRSSGPISA
jgi:lactate dehydrogenase-like 2-hydroxyacid dehydrogenase